MNLRPELADLSDTSSRIVVGCIFALQCAIWGWAGRRLWIRWQTQRTFRLAEGAAKAAQISVVDISRIAAQERWARLLGRVTGYVVLAPFLVALVCWANGSRLGMWIALGLSVPVMWACGALQRQSKALAWAIVGLWAAGCIGLSSAAILSAPTISSGITDVLATFFSISFLGSPLLFWAWRVLELWHSQHPGSCAFRAVKVYVETPENARACEKRERRRFSSEKHSGKVAVLSGAAAMQSLLGFASLFTGTSVLNSALAQTAEATRHRARQFRALPGSTLLEQDEQAPVLYLRSFIDDGLFFDTWSGRVTWEKPIVDAGLLVGPVIAIGRPGEDLARVGAARDYLSDDEWQAHAQRWMEVAQIIILVVGETSGLAWEATELLTRQLLQKTILLMPPLPDAEMSQRWSTFVSNLDPNGPYGELSKLDTRYTLAVIFDESATPTAIYSARRSRESDFNWVVKTAIGLIRERETVATAVATPPDGAGKDAKEVA